MTHENSPSEALTEELIQTSAEIEHFLGLCALATETGQYFTARRHVNTAAAKIRSLQRLMHKRRGHPREEVQRAIVYYAAWQMASVGRLEVTKSGYRSQTGFQLLRNALKMAEQHSIEYYSTAEYKVLVERIDAWHDAARQRTIEPSDD